MTIRAKAKALPAVLRVVRPVHLVVRGAPRTKKTSNQIWRAKKGRRIIVPSQAWLLWVATASIRWYTADEAPQLWPRPARPLLDWRVNVCATFFRDADRGDAVGYYQGLADLLERFGIVPNDRLFVSWDGSTLRVDRDEPRVEVTLTPVPD